MIGLDSTAGTDSPVLRVNPDSEQKPTYDANEIPLAHDGTVRNCGVKCQDSAYVTVTQVSSHTRRDAPSSLTHYCAHGRYG